VRLAQLCAEYGLHMTYVGTAYPFTSYEQPDDLTSLTIIHENTQPNFTGNCYSIAKGFAERWETHIRPKYHYRLLQPYLSNIVLNARLSLPINFDMTSKRNLLAKLVEYNTVNDITGSFT
jgi:hypothetical protein